MRATHHLHPNVRFLQLRSSDEKSTVRSDRKSLIKLKKANRMVSLFCYIYILDKNSHDVNHIMAYFIWSGRRESNPPLKLGKLAFYR